MFSTKIVSSAKYTNKCVSGNGSEILGRVEHIYFFVSEKKIIMHFERLYCLKRLMLYLDI